VCLVLCSGVLRCDIEKVSHFVVRMKTPMVIKYTSALCNLHNFIAKYVYDSDRVCIYYQARLFNVYLITQYSYSYIDGVLRTRFWCLQK
jgi:hypothetical protein